MSLRSDANVRIDPPDNTTALDDTSAAEQRQGFHPTRTLIELGSLPTSGGGGIGGDDRSDNSGGDDSGATHWQA